MNHRQLPTSIPALMLAAWLVASCAGASPSLVPPAAPAAAATTTPAMVASEAAASATTAPTASATAGLPLVPASL